MITGFTCLPSYRHSSFTLWAYLCWRHTYCQWPIIELAMNVSPKNKMAASHVVQIHTHARFPRSKKWPTYHVAVCRTNRKCSSFATKHFQRKSLKIFDLHPPPRRLVSFVARINTWKVRCWVTDTHTNTQTKYCNPRCACAPRVNMRSEGFKQQACLRSIHAVMYLRWPRILFKRWHK